MSPRNTPTKRRKDWTLERYGLEADRVIAARSARLQADALQVEAQTRTATVAAMCDGNRQGALGIYAHGLLHASLIDDGMPRDHQAALSAAVVKLDQLGGRE